MLRYPAVFLLMKLIATRIEDSIRLVSRRIRIRYVSCRYGTKFRKSKRLRRFCRRDVCNPERGDIIIAYTCRGFIAFVTSNEGLRCA